MNIADGFSPREAGRFRRAFREWCDFYGATNSDVGKALNDTEELRPKPKGKAPDGDGQRAVANAMVKSRPLTHRAAIRVLVALLISEPAVDAANKLAKVSVPDPVPDKARNLLVELGALDLNRPANPPVFVLPRGINALARNLADGAAEAAGIRKGRDALAKGIAKRLRRDAPLMARDFCDTLEQHGGTFGKRANPLIDRIAFELFGNDYVSARAIPSWGPAFEVLHRKRPETALGHPIDVRAIERGKATKSRKR